MDLRKVETPSFCSAEVVEISIEGHPSSLPVFFCLETDDWIITEVEG
jgi:hypothetical protein